MDDLVTFLRARLDGWAEGHPDCIHRCDGGDFWVSDKPCEIARMVAAQRAVVDCCARIADLTFIGSKFPPGDDTELAALILAHLVAVYTDRDGYRPEWVPRSSD